MADGQLRLLATRRLGPLFVTQFLGALNDNLFKNALVILIAYRDTNNARATELLVTAAAAIFILPYFLFSATAGQLADKYEKARLVRWIKLWEIGVMALAALGFAAGSGAFQLGVLFLLGVQATFFGPVKYGILPELLPSGELLSGNALIEAGTFLAILVGTIAGGLLILAPHGPLIVGATQLAIAAGGWGASLAIPQSGRAAPTLGIARNLAKETWTIVRDAYRARVMRLPLLGISWFWLVGSAYLAQFPNFAKESVGGGNQVVTLFLTIFSVGIGIGSLACGRLQHGRIDARLVPLAAVGLALFGLDLWAAIPATAAPAALADALVFMRGAGHWRIMLDLFAISVAGGIFCVPLYAIMQDRSEPAYRARIIAANNIMNALFMVLGAAISGAFLAAGWGIGAIFLALAVGNGGVAVFAFLAR